MGTSHAEIDEAQRLFCSQHASVYVPVLGDSKTGFASSTKGLNPINGLRHPAAGDTSGWYIWCGETFSEAADFFDTVHTYHLYDDYPQIAYLFGLPPGYRFLAAGDYLDVWYDASLLDV
jgi:hypothetical protein